MYEDFDFDFFPYSNNYQLFPLQVSTMKLTTLLYGRLCFRCLYLNFFSAAKVKDKKIDVLHDPEKLAIIVENAEQKKALEKLRCA
ncbi:MAG: hypothetical protein QXD29_06005 [Thermoplasmata archaeon]